MSLRSLTIVALVLAVGAVVAWVWFGGSGSPAVHPAAPELPSSPITAGNSRTGQPMASVASVARETATPKSKTPAITPTQPVPITSSVSPGMPLVRTTATPSRLVVSAQPPLPLAPASQAEVKAELEEVQFMLRDFRTRMGENPVGSNAEIMYTVMGGSLGQGEPWPSYRSAGQREG